MSLVHQIAHNTILQSVAKIVTTLLGVVAFAFMTRYLGTEGFGGYTTVTSFLQFFGVLADCGLSLVALQMISEVGHEPKKTYHAIFTLRFITITAFTLLAPAVSLFFPYPLELKVGIALMSLSFFISSLIQMVRVVFQHALRMDIPLYADVASYIVLLGGIWAVVAYDLGFYALLGVITLNNLVQLFILLFSAEGFIPIRFGWDRAIMRETFRRSWPIALSIACNLIYLRTDSLILSLVKSQEEVGLYGAAYRVIDILASFPSMFMGLTLSSFAKSWSQNDTVAFARYFQKSFDFMVITAIPLIVGTYFVARPMMVAVSGISFAESGDVLRILVLGAGALFFGNLIGHLINVIHAQRAMLVYYAATAGIGLVGYLFFIPLFSYWGAAWMTVATEALVVIGGWYLFWKRTRISPRLAILGKTVLASACMALVLWMTQSLSIIFTIPLAVGVYVACLIPLNVIPRSFLSHFLPPSR